MNPLLVIWKEKPRPRRKQDVLSLGLRVKNISPAEDGAPGSRVQEVHRALKGERVTAARAQVAISAYRVSDKRGVD